MGLQKKIQTLIDSDPESNLDQMLLDRGVVESGSLNIDLTSNISNLQDLVYEMFEAQEEPVSETVEEILTTIIDKGIILSCYKGNLVLASVETWLKYAEAAGLTCTAPVPPA